jgi:transposase
MNLNSGLPIIGLDLAKSVFQLHIATVASGKVVNRQIKRSKLSESFATHAPCMVAMEACASAHFWARKIESFGHQVKLLPAQHVKPFVHRDKTDAKDAQAIWIAAQQPHIKPVLIKSVHQQTCLALHSMRSQLMKIRMMQTNSLRGILAEFGICLPEGHTHLLKNVQHEIAKGQQSSVLQDDLVACLQEQLRRIITLQDDIDAIGRRIKATIRHDRQMQSIQEIPGIGDLSASALVASVGNASTFRSAGQFTSWLGLVPRQTGTGGKVFQHGISKRGDAYLRTLIIAGARAVLARSSQLPWLSQLLSRRPYNVVVVALANKIARTVWAVLTKGVQFNRDKWQSTV